MKKLILIRLSVLLWSSCILSSQGLVAGEVSRGMLMFNFLYQEVNRTGSPVAGAKVLDLLLSTQAFGADKCNARLMMKYSQDINGEEDDEMDWCENIEYETKQNEAAISGAFNACGYYILKDGRRVPKDDYECVVRLLEKIRDSKTRDIGVMRIFAYLSFIDRYKIEGKLRGADTRILNQVTLEKYDENFDWKEPLNVKILQDLLLFSSVQVSNDSKIYVPVLYMPNPYIEYEVMGKFFNFFCRILAMSSSVDPEVEQGRYNVISGYLRECSVDQVSPKSLDALVKQVTPFCKGSSSFDWLKCSFSSLMMSYDEKTITGYLASFMGRMRRVQDIKIIKGIIAEYYRGPMSVVDFADLLKLMCVDRRDYIPLKDEYLTFLESNFTDRQQIFKELFDRDTATENHVNIYYPY
ncbi:MAG: hypothetical protein WBQ73_04255 [Candidatus Babeliales bacterium]